MSIMGQKFRHRLLAAGVALSLPLLVWAAPSEPPDQGRGGCAAGLHRGPLPGPPVGGPGLMGGHGPMDMGPDDDRPPPFLMDVELTEDQQDKLFAITHAAAPALRDQSKAARKARDALREFTRSPQFSLDTAATLAQSLGKAESQLALLRTRLEHDVFAVLTPEQRTQIDRRHPQAHHGEAPSRY